MKKGLKFWSKLLIASFFLGGMATSAMAQNGTTKAKCAEGDPLAIITRTVAQMDSTDGTVVTLKFDVTANPGLVGDEFYLVTETNGSLTSLENCTNMGKGLQFMRANYRDGADATTGLAATAVGTIPSNGVVSFNIKAMTANQSRTYHLGVFVKDVAVDPTSCFSDVYDVQIEVITNIYAMLTLNNGVANEYICSGGTTNTNIGFKLCNLPLSVSADETMKGRLYYTVKPSAFVSLEGMAIATSGTTGPSITLTPVDAEISADVEISRNVILNSGTTPYVLQIGQQTITNNSRGNYDKVVYEFVEGLDKFYYTYTDANGNFVTLPVKFVTAVDNCGDNPTGDQLSHSFTVYVAPSFTVQALAFKSDAERGDHITAHPDNETYMEADNVFLEPTFCQGTLGYFRAKTSTECGGNITYAWTGTPALTADNIATPNTADEFTDIAASAYTLTVNATWTDEGGNFTGCTALDNMPITITPAPILLLATDQADPTDPASAYNVTDQITAPKVCPGNPIDINTNETEGFAGDAQRVDYMNAGNYIRANGATLSYIVSPYSDPEGDVAAYTAWRSNPAAQNGTLNVTDHYLNNSSAAQANITYTIQNAGTGTNTCALVKSDGQPLTDGKVQIIYPVEPRPQFQLGAN
ncbi:MAG: hypothetical protein IKY79_03955 [Bacteroidales bacterium]|nr:hypothetical protein [Bacteroidales bacterium]